MSVNPQAGSPQADAAGAGRTVTELRMYRRLLGYVWPYALAFVFSIAGYLLYAASNVAFVQLIEFVVDYLGGEGQSERSLLSVWLGDGAAEHGQVRLAVPLLVVVIAFLRGLGSFVGGYFIVYVSTNLVHALRCDIFDRLLNLPSAFFDRNALGHVVTRVTFHVTQVTGAATTAIRVVIREGFTVLAYLVYMFYLNWRLTLIFLVVSPFIGLLVTWAGRRFRRISRRIQMSMGDVTHVASEAVQGYREIRTYGGQAHERGRFQRVSNANRKQSLKMAVTSSVSTPTVQFLVASVLALLVWLLFSPALLADMTAGNVIGFITVAGLLTKPLRLLTAVNETIQKGMAAAAEIFGLLDEATEPDGGGRQLARVAGRVEFRDVCFAYDLGGREVLQNISFVAEPGQTVALVGHSGSGKSTLASLIPRFYAPSRGEILLDGVPVETLSLDNLRSQIAVVTQHVTLFNDTVANNIAYGSLGGRGREEILQAAQQAHARDFVEALEQGLDTVVGDDGVLLSGGQRQRLAIARAFLKDAPILILDEATSALDAESERNIQRALEAVAVGRTTFVIAHRLSTIENADVILVMDQGRIVERGTHGELLAAGGHYARLQRHQLVGEAEEAASSAGAGLPAMPRQPVSAHGQALVEAWYGGGQWPLLMWPLSVLFRLLAGVRRYWLERQQRWQAPFPVLVVGNIALGGTGKTPLVIALAERFAALGLRVAVVSRGYGGRAAGRPRRVPVDGAAAEYGDEAVMMARRLAACGCPVVVDRDRVRAVRSLCVEGEGVDEGWPDLVISDDGLQHYALARRLEVAVYDGRRGVGNGYCLPAGPLREPLRRFDEVDFVIHNGGDEAGREAGSAGETLLYPHALRMRLRPQCWIGLHDRAIYALRDEGGGAPVVPQALAAGSRVHAVSAIGNPQRFFASLRSLGLVPVCHPYGDHHAFRRRDVVFADDLPVVMTEKDAAKVCEFVGPLPHDDYFALRVDAEVDTDGDAEFALLLLERLGLHPLMADVA